MVAGRIDAFRSFAGQLSAQVVEQMCQEFEREVQVLWNDILMYRCELDRVAQLLRAQLDREQKLHGVIEQMVTHSDGVFKQASWMASQQPGNTQIHQWIEQIMGQHGELLNHTVNSVGQANAVLQQHYVSAANMRTEAINAENEFARIVALLSQPPIPGVAPAPTVAVVPGTVANLPRSAPQSSRFPSAQQTMPSMSTPPVSMVIPQRQPSSPPQFNAMSPPGPVPAQFNAPSPPQPLAMVPGVNFAAPMPAQMPPQQPMSRPAVTYGVQGMMQPRQGM